MPLHRAIERVVVLSIESNVPSQDRLRWYVQGVEGGLETSPTTRNPTPSSGNNTLQPPAKEGCFFGVFDGHGGHEVAEFLRKELPSSVERSKQKLMEGPESARFRKDKKALLNEALKRGFECADQGLYEIAKTNPKLRSGSCAVVALIDNDMDSLFVANVGDSKAVLAQLSPTNSNQVLPVPLSTEHNCKNEREKELVRKRTKDPNAIRSTTVSASEFAKALAEQKSKQAEEAHQAKANSARGNSTPKKEESSDEVDEDQEEAEDADEEEDEEEEETEEEEEEDDDRFLDEFESKAWDSDDEPFDTQALINLILNKSDPPNKEDSKGAESKEKASTPPTSKRRNSNSKKSRSQAEDHEDEEDGQQEEEDEEEAEDEENESDSEEEESEEVQPAPQPERVAGCLMVTRAFGDLFLKYPELSYRPFVHFVPYITCEPEIVVHDSTGRDRFLVVASDGLWEMFSDQQVVDMIHSFEQEYNGSNKRKPASGGSSLLTASSRSPSPTAMQQSNKLTSDKEFAKALTDHITHQFFERVAEDKGVDVEFLNELTPEQRRFAFDDTTVIIVFFKSTELPKK